MHVSASSSVERQRFTGQKVLIIGSTMAEDDYEDISHSTAVAMALEGAEVITAQANINAAIKSAREIKEVGGIATPAAIDPGSNTDFYELYEVVSAKWDNLDILITSHFCANFGSSLTTTVPQLEEALRINITAPFLATQMFTSLLEKSTHPAIVHVGSIDGIYGNPNVPSYSIAKGGTHVLIHVLAAELAAKNIRVNGIARAASTALPLSNDALTSLEYATPLARAATPAEYAQPILYLASKEASYITGAILPVDGGRTASTPGTSPGFKGY